MIGNKKLDEAMEKFIGLLGCRIRVKKARYTGTVIKVSYDSRGRLIITLKRYLFGWTSELEVDLEALSEYEVYP